MTPAAASIRDRLEEAGRITVAEFMTLALYGAGGYYRTPRERIGPAGDFYTSPTVHPAFGALLAGQVGEIWRRLGRPEPFSVLELGSGRGTLAADMLLAWRDGAPDLFQAVRYTLADLAPPADLPAAIASRVVFRPAGADLGGCDGVAIANEFLDALPVHRITTLRGELRELYVVDLGDRLGEAPGPLSDPALALQAATWPEPPAEGAVAEVPLALLEWCRGFAGTWRRGVALLVDYGADRAALLGRKGGTLRAFRRHRLLSSPFDSPGEADVTSHVDFGALRACFERLGCSVLGEVSQSEFLQNLGMAELRGALADAPLPPAAREANLAALDDLVAPRGLGGFRVLAVSKSVAPDLAGLGCGPRLRPLCAPALTRRHMALWGGGPLAATWHDVDASGLFEGLDYEVKP